MPKVRTGVSSAKKTAARDIKNHVYANMTAKQAEQWIEDNVTNLASAKTALKHLVKMLIYLRDYSNISEEG